MSITRKVIVLLALFAGPLAAQTADRLAGRNVSIANTNYKGRSAVQVIATPGTPDGASYAVVKDVGFRDGTIEVELAGQPAAGAFGTARGFIGIAFRLGEDGHYEYIYLRPTNGRADDQVRRNHSTQYGAHPDFGFAISRRDAPEKYESYVDLEPGVWTKFKIEVEDRKARLYVHGAEQPCLIVNDMKLEPREGKVALWAGPGTEGYFSNLKITPKPQRSAAAEIENLMRQLYSRGQFNGAVLVARQGKVIYRAAFGLSDQSSGAVFRPETPSCLASLSKPFTALAIMMLAEKKRLSYDDPIARHCPELPEKLGAVTVRQLLSHTSGIPDYSSDLNIEHPGITAAEVLNALRAVNQPIFPPGERYRYSNTGYLLLGLVVERLSGMPLPDYLEEHVFGRLGMKTTFAFTAGRQKSSDVARGYDDFGSPNDSGGYLGGEGGLYSTVDDLFTFDQALYTEKLVKRETLDEAFTPAKVRVGQTSYGLGWNAASDGAGGKRVWHTGNTAGFRAFLERRPDAGITVIMLTNRGNSKRVEINQAIQNILAGQSYELPRKSIAVAMHEIILKSGMAAGIPVYEGAKTSQASEYDVDEGEINMLGYRLLYGDHRLEDAVRIFSLNIREHPSSSNAFDSLAEAYQAMGDKVSARKYYGIALEKDPQNLHAKGMLAKLR
jgi:CubicO group peptidase (beta-lactamase class C family)